ncbi:MAG: hypothetical protein IPG45_10965 [Deltaproteobacteria bacterium]|nr:hypothetical protein [Deltaproteobacteria bacterium]
MWTRSCLVGCLGLLIACSPSRERGASSGPRAPGDGGGGVDATLGQDAGGDSGLSFEAGIGVDAEDLDSGGSGDGGAQDLGGPDLGGVDGSVDLGFPDAGGHADAAPVPPAGEVLVTTNCGADFGGEIVVSFNGSFGVGSLRGGFQLVSSLQFDLAGQSGTITLGTQHRIQTGLVVNLVIGSTWTNLSQDVDVITGALPDTITGTLVVHDYRPQVGVVAIDLVNVRLQNASDLSFCTLNGTVRTSRLGR